MPCSALEWAQAFIINFMESLFWVPPTHLFPLCFLLPWDLPLFNPPARKLCLLCSLPVIVPTSRDKWWEHREEKKKKVGREVCPALLKPQLWDWRGRSPSLGLFYTYRPPAVTARSLFCPSLSQRSSPKTVSTFMPTSKFTQSRWQDTRGKKVNLPIVLWCFEFFHSLPATIYLSVFK